MVAQQAGQAVRRGCRPVGAGGGARGGDRTGGDGQTEDADALRGRGRVGFGGEVGARFGEGEVGAEDRAVFGNVEGEPVEGDVVVALAERERVAPAEERAQDVRDPLVAARRGVVLPVRVAGPQAGAFVLLQGVELGPGMSQDRHREEGARDLGEVQPFLVLAAAVERLRLGCGETRGDRAAGAHRQASFAGITKTTATGKRWARGSR